jgi:hypothetical protein
MTSGVISLAEKKPLRQTTLRVEADLLRKARFYLDEDGKSVTEFLIEQLEQYVQRREQSGTKPLTQECA